MRQEYKVLTDLYDEFVDRYGYIVDQICITFSNDLVKCQGYRQKWCTLHFM